MKTMKTMTCDTCTVTIWIAGDQRLARQVCREWALRGACVSVTDVDYVYTMGCESGVRVDLINYPRFPLTEDELLNRATGLAYLLCDHLHQGSFTVQSPNGTTFYSRRGDVL